MSSTNAVTRCVSILTLSVCAVLGQSSTAEADHPSGYTQATIGVCDGNKICTLFQRPNGTCVHDDEQNIISAPGGKLDGTLKLYGNEEDNLYVMVGADREVCGKTLKPLKFTSRALIKIEGGGGNDSFNIRNNTSVPVRVSANLGDGNDYLLFGGTGTGGFTHVAINGGSGNDTLWTWQGTGDILFDSVSLGSGADAVQLGQDEQFYEFATPLNCGPGSEDRVVGWDNTEGTSSHLACEFVSH